MSVIDVSKDELFGIMQYLNLIRAKFQDNDVWTVYPVLYSSYDSVDIIYDPRKNVVSVQVGHKVLFKFQKQGYEYLVNGEVDEISQDNPSTITIKFIEAKKYFNLRKHMRFESCFTSEVKHTCLDGAVEPRNICCSGIIKNLSKGGAMFSTSLDVEINDIIDIRISFESGNYFASKAKVLRKQSVGNEEYSYGVQFIEVSADNLRTLNLEIKKLEKAYFSSLREYKKSESVFDTRFAIFSFDIDESYDIREELVKIGAENFDVINNFKFYYGFLSDEKPKFIIFDSNVMDDEVVELVEKIRTEFPQVGILLILPIIYQQAEEYKQIFDSLDVLYKPLIYNEFEDKIIKYL
ncbi:MAG: PilZ domain protein [Firmicutes bacterium ADurb.Bin419]|nr:MAG: PilZ domain protein [Firmicutes bacterium ADurb.Bin419]